MNTSVAGAFGVPLIPATLAQSAPQLHVSRWFGDATTIEALRGRVVAVHAFQMLCPGCVLHGVPQAARVHHHFDTADVAVLGLHSVFEHHGAMLPVGLEAFLHEFRVPFPVAVDAHAGGDAIPLTMRAYNLRGTPSLLLIDRRGRLRANVFGRPSDLAVGAAIATLAAESTDGARTDRALLQSSDSAPASCAQVGCVIPDPLPRS